jgi:membrane associated rhomboid family serine protease
VLPIGDDNRRRETLPYVNYALIGLNLLAFAVELSQPNPELFIAKWGVVPAAISHGAGLGTLLTSMFLHAGWAHIGGNMLFLWIFGDNVEDRLGHARYLAFYLACGIAAALVQAFLAPASFVPSIGASGAISGVLAAYMLMFGGNTVRVLIGFFFVAAVPAFVVIGVWIVVQFVNGLASFAYTAQSGGVAYGAHIGGFAAGILLAWLIPKRRPVRRYYRFP